MISKANTSALLLTCLQKTYNMTAVTQREKMAVNQNELWVEILVKFYLG